MYSTGDIYIGSLRISRIWQHIIFWLAAYTAMIIIYGYSKPFYSIVVRNNFYYIPVHILYFYVLAYWLIPRFLLRQKIAQFLALLLILFLSTIYLTRIVDVTFVDPYEIRRLGPDWVWYPPTATTFWERVFNPGSFFGALKGINLIVWVALAIKLFKLWLERKNAALQTELNFLKSQIHPHFLFNTLNNLYALTLSHSPKAPEVVLKLSEMMRYMLYECNTDEIDLKKDIAILEEYIELEKIRYEDRLDLSFSINGDLQGLLIPPLLLLPLVENAFKHGAGKKRGTTWISIDLFVAQGKLKFKVWNSKAVNQENNKQGSGIGLSNLEKRLLLLYGEAAQLKLIDEEDMFLAVLEIDLDKRLVV